MNIYIDESGSINNHNSAVAPYFVICLVRVVNKRGLEKAYKRFIASRHERLKELDRLKGSGIMFQNEKFLELKGYAFDRDMRRDFVNFFVQKKHFEVYYIILDNKRASNTLCSNTARAFNYLVCKNFECLFARNIIPDEECCLQLDERNEKTETKHFLENYLNTELMLSNVCSHPFTVQYFDSSQNKFIQIADVFANLMYAHLRTGAYKNEFDMLKEENIVKFHFRFPLP